jgi:hypothetical protein
VKFGELGGRCCNLGAQKEGGKDNGREAVTAQEVPLLGIGCFYRCPPIARASLSVLLVDQVAWVPLPGCQPGSPPTQAALASAAQEPVMRSRCDAASNGRVLDGYITCVIISHLFEAFDLTVVEAGLSASKGRGWDRKTNENLTGCNLKSSFSPGTLQ